MDHWQDLAYLQHEDDSNMYENVANIVKIM